MLSKNCRKNLLLLVVWWVGIPVVERMDVKVFDVFLLFIILSRGVISCGNIIIIDI